MWNDPNPVSMSMIYVKEQVCMCARACAASCLPQHVTQAHRLGIAAPVLHPLGLPHVRPSDHAKLLIQLQDRGLLSIYSRTPERTSQLRDPRWHQHGVLYQETQTYEKHT